jgi:hypothetical protein
VLEFPNASGPLEFSYDEEWLAILKATHSLMNLQRRPWPMPALAAPPTQEQLENVRQRLQQRGGWLDRTAGGLVWAGLAEDTAVCMRAGGKAGCGYSFIRGAESRHAAAQTL